MQPAKTQSKQYVMSKISHRAANNWLTALVVLLGLYITAIPFLPHLALIRDQISDDTGGVRYTGILAEQNNVSDEVLAEAPTENRLVLPSITLDEPVVVGEDPSNVHLGVWHRPRSSTPDKGGNTVLVGHRFSYSSPATFYHLDKMEVDDKFAIWWEGKEYVYQVFQTVIVGATAIEIEANTDEPIATIYTCTPVWTAENRLVVKAKLINPETLEETT